MHEDVQYESPKKIFADLRVLEAEIIRGMDELEKLI